MILAYSFSYIISYFYIMRSISTKFGFFILILFFASACVKEDDKNDSNALISELMPRKNTKGTEKEWENIQNRYKELAATLNSKPEDNAAKVSMTELFMNEARITGESVYYGAALKVINAIIADAKAKQDQVFLAKSYKASILLSLHQFADAKKVAEEAAHLNPYDAGVFGALVDANVELGNYEEAVKLCDQMLSIRPDLRSYSRASYIRQIYGDNAGAIEAMKMAITAGPVGMEATEWARVNLGDLYLNLGRLDTAKWIYTAALEARPQYPFAEMGLAKVARAEKKYDEAIAHTKNAIRYLGESSFVSFLADVYELKGDAKKAKEIREDVLDLLLEGEKENAKETLAKHNGNRELATAKLNVGKLDEALENAKIDLAMRPENVDANELMAWIYYKKGDFVNAKIHADKMLKTNTKNANTLYKASIIYAAAGELAKGQTLKTQALAINQHIDPKITDQDTSTTLSTSLRI